jgi:hypothetical protein
MKATTSRSVQILSEELLITIDSIQGLLTLAQYHQTRTEMNTYLGLISICILRVEEIVRKTNETVRTTNESVL